MARPKKKVEVKLPNGKRKDARKISFVSILILLIGSGILGFFNVSLNIKVSELEKKDGKNVEIKIETGSTIEFAKNQNIRTILETEDGEIEVTSTPVVDMVDGGEIQIQEKDLNLGKGEYYPIDTPQTFRDSTLGKCIDLDNFAGSQCTDLFALFNKEYTGRWITTCGTGTARGIWDCKEKNAGNEYKLIYNAKDIETGDWIVFDGGQYGHVGMALGNVKNGYVALLGENQGGSSCAGGGSATNIINMSIKTFKGAFRPKIYDVPKVPDTGIVKAENAIERK